MFTIRRSSQAARDAQAAARARDALESAIAAGGPEATVPAAVILGLLAGQASPPQEAEQGAAASPVQENQPPAGPVTDPLTGCAWAGPPGSAPPAA